MWLAWNLSGARWEWFHLRIQDSLPNLSADFRTHIANYQIQQTVSFRIFFAGKKYVFSNPVLVFWMRCVKWVQRTRRISLWFHDLYYLYSPPTRKKQKNTRFDNQQQNISLQKNTLNCPSTWPWLIASHLSKQWLIWTPVLSFHEKNLWKVFGKWFFWRKKANKSYTHPFFVFVKLTKSWTPWRDKHIKHSVGKHISQEKKTVKTTNTFCFLNISTNTRLLDYWCGWKL